MREDVPTGWRRLAIALGVLASIAVLMPAAAGAASPAGDVLGGLSPAAAAPASAGCADRRRLRAALLCLVNRERRAAGLPALRRDRRITRAAARHARDMARRGYLAHQRQGGPDLGTRLSRAGWNGSAWAEAIASGCGGTLSPAEIVAGWMASPPHRAVLLGADYRRAGTGVARAGCSTWVLDVGRPR